MINEKKAASLAEIIRCVNEIAKEWTPDPDAPEELWYRGDGQKNDLLPTLYHERALSFNYDEASMFERFKAIGASFANPLPRDDWDWYFLARHHGLPSRLLDWSMSLFVAIYFSIYSHIMKYDRLQIDQKLSEAKAPSSFDDSSPIIWVIDAGTLNQFSCKKDVVFSPDKRLGQDYWPENLARDDVGIKDNKWPIAVLPPRYNSRLAAQQGVFTLHGTEKVALNHLAAANSVIHLACILIDKSSIFQIWQELEVSGMSIIQVFPELDSVAKHISWIYQSKRG